VDAQDIWASVYSSANCATSTLTAEQALSGSNTCLSYTASGMTVSVNFQCVGITEASGWSAQVFMSGDCSGTVLTSLTGSDACDCQGESVFGLELGLSVSCTGAAPVTCAEVTLAPTGTPQSAAPTTLAEAGTPVWGAVYASQDCATDTFIADGVADIDDGGCFGTTVDGTAVSVSFSCDGETADSPWEAGVYFTTDCSGFKMITLSAEDACTCGGVSLMGYNLGAYVNCGGEEPSCEDGGDGGGEGGGSNSDGEGSGSGTDSSSTILLAVVLIMGVLFALVLARYVYNSKCQRKHESLDEVGFIANMNKEKINDAAL
jgi:hypothetical protein